MKQLRLVGIDVAPKPTQAQLDAQHLQLLQAWDGTRFNPAKVPIPQPTVRPIFADSQGNRHILLPTTTGDMVAVPWIASLQSDLATASGGAGGFVPIKSFPKTQPVSADAALMAKVVNAVSVKNSAASDSTNPTSGGSSSSPASNSSSGGLAGLINKEIQKYENMTPLDWLAKAMSHGTEAYKYLFGDPAKLGSPSNSDGPMCFPGDGEPGADPSIWDKLTSLKNIEGGLGSLAEMGLGAALASVGNALLDKVLPVTDSSSLGAQLTAQAAQQVLGQLEGVAKSVAVDLGKQALAGLGTGLGDGGKGVGAVLDGSIADFQKKIDDALEKYTSPGIQGFKWSTASFAMARTGDSTTHGGMIVGTAAKTVLGGVAKPICVLDTQFCPTPTHLSGPVTQGNPTVLIEGRWAARALHTANCVGATTTVKPLVSDVLIGADTKTIAVPVQPAKPKVPPKPAAANPATPPKGPSTPPPLPPQLPPTDQPSMLSKFAHGMLNTYVPPKFDNRGDVDNEVVWNDSLGQLRANGSGSDYVSVDGPQFTLDAGKNGAMIGASAAGATAQTTVGNTTVLVNLSLGPTLGGTIKDHTLTLGLGAGTLAIKNPYLPADGADFVNGAVDVAGRGLDVAGRVVSFIILSDDDDDD